MKIHFFKALTPIENIFSLQGIVNKKKEYYQKFINRIIFYFEKKFSI